MHRRLLVGAAAVAMTAGAFLLPAPASAAGLCLDAHVVVQGQELLNQSQCLPPEGAPTLP